MVNSKIRSKTESRIRCKTLHNTYFHKIRRNNKDYRRMDHNSHNNMDYNNRMMEIRCKNPVRMMDTSLNKRDRASTDQSNYRKTFSICRHRSSYRNSHNLSGGYYHNLALKSNGTISVSTASEYSFETSVSAA